MLDVGNYEKYNVCIRKKDKVFFMLLGGGGVLRVFNFVLSFGVNCYLCGI